MDKVLLSSKKMDWCTPQSLFDTLNQEFNFTLDVAASDLNAKCPSYYTVNCDALRIPWRGTIFCNPPYGRELHKWVRKSYTASRLGATVVMLIPARTDASYWHKYIFPHAEIRFLPGRIEFEDEYGNKHGRAPFPSAVIIFRPNTSDILPHEASESGWCQSPICMRRNTYHDK